jgi:hypothetical protein
MSRHDALPEPDRVRHDTNHSPKQSRDEAPVID